MKTEKERSKEKLLHILSAIDKIRLYTNDFTEHQFIADVQIQDSVLLQFSIIGEAIIYVDGDILKKYDYAWHEVRALRNVITHEYFGIKMTKIWSTILFDLPELKIIVHKILENEF